MSCLLMGSLSSPIFTNQRDGRAASCWNRQRVPEVEQAMWRWGMSPAHTGQQENARKTRWMNAEKSRLSKHSKETEHCMRHTHTFTHTHRDLQLWCRHTDSVQCLFLSRSNEMTRQDFWRQYCICNSLEKLQPSLHWENKTGWKWWNTSLFRSTKTQTFGLKVTLKETWSKEFVLCTDDVTDWARQV